MSSSEQNSTLFLPGWSPLATQLLSQHQARAWIYWQVDAAAAAAAAAVEETTTPSAGSGSGGCSVSIPDEKNRGVVVNDLVLVGRPEAPSSSLSTTTTTLLPLPPPHVDWATRLEQELQVTGWWARCRQRSGRTVGQVQAQQVWHILSQSPYAALFSLSTTPTTITSAPPPPTTTHTTQGEEEGGGGDAEKDPDQDKPENHHHHPPQEEPPPRSAAASTLDRTATGAPRLAPTVDHERRRADPATQTRTVAPTPRGDQSIWMNRSYRQQPFFPTQHPHLHQFLHRLQQTCQHYLGSVLEFDFSLTSVQLAEYRQPGAAYPRHVDHHHHIYVTSSSSVTTTAPPAPHRILTAVLYLTPSTWSVEAHGGCLRVYHDNNHDDDDDDDDNSPGTELKDAELVSSRKLRPSPSRYTDIAPYRNRLVLFRADAVEHAVLPCFGLRRALTIWLYGRSRPPVTTLERPSRALASPSADRRAEGASTDPKSPHPTPLFIRAPSSGYEERSTIFVAVASLRDSETGPTLGHLMEMAAHPARVFVGLVLQLDLTGSSEYTTTPNDDDHPAGSRRGLARYDQEYVVGRLPTLEDWYHNRVRVLTLDARHATGPCPARAFCQGLYRGEDYVLQIDAHMRFRPGWDMYLIQQLHLLEEDESSNHQPPKVLLSTYPVGYELPNSIPAETRGPVLRPWKFDEHGILRQKSTFLTGPPPSKPVLSHLFAAGFCFGRGPWIQDCPYDGTLHHLFFGEEISMSVRLFTLGYDIYAPIESVCYHLWSRAHRPPLVPAPPDAPKSPDQYRHESRQVVLRQVRGQDAPGLGSRRTTQEWAAVLGVDFEKALLLRARQD